MTRHDLIHELADSLCDAVDLKTLLQMYYDDQVDYLSSLSDNELLEMSRDYLDDTIELTDA